MLDPKNSTQISNKEEKNRVTPVGGDFASFEEKETELGNILGDCLSAIGRLSFQVTSTLFEAGKWTAIETSNAVGATVKTASVSEKPKEPPKPEDQEKKMKEALIHRQSMEAFKREEERVPQQAYAEMVAMALRMGVNVENLADKIKTPLRKEELLKTYYIALGASVESAEKKASEQAKKAESVPKVTSKTSAGPSLNANEAPEGKSATSVFKAS